MNNFWDNVLLMVSTFFFIAYLIILFQIVVDLFRDRELGGGAKVLWLLGLIFLPVLTALLYILSRGGSCRLWSRGSHAHHLQRSRRHATGAAVPFGPGVNNNLGVHGESARHTPSRRRARIDGIGKLTA